MIFNKDRLLKYGDYLKETLDTWKVKNSIKSFNRISEDQYTIHGDLKDLSIELTNILSGISLPYNKLILFGGIEIDIKIIQSNRYYSNIDWIKFLKSDYEIIVEVVKNYDMNYVTSLIIHEIRHMIDFSDGNINSGLSSFDIEQKLRNFNKGDFMEFFKLVYISLEHELVARNNQVYPYIKFKNLSKEQSIDILNKSFISQALYILKSFNYIDFINKFNSKELIEISNNFIIDCLHDKVNKIEDEEDLLKFYKIWDEYFNETSDKWKILLMREVDIIYERKNFKIDFCYENNYKHAIMDIWGNIKLKLQ